MKFVQDKCTYTKIEKGKNTTTSAIEINVLKIKPIQEGESYRYLSQDENVAYERTINKERVTKEYLSRVKKIWSSELNNHCTQELCNFCNNTIDSHIRLDYTRN